MVFRGDELKYDNSELLRGQNHVIKVKRRSKRPGKKAYHVIPLYAGFFWVINSVEAYFLTLDVNMRF